MEPRTEPDRHVPKGTVLTITMLGTNEHRNSEHSILTEFHGAIETGPKQFKLLIDGIGGGPFRDPTHPRLGGYSYTKPAIDRNGGEIVYTKTPRWFHEIPNKVMAIVKGTGMDASIAEALDVIQQLLTDSQKTPEAMPITLNLVGFSRGADTIRRLCNELNTRYGKDLICVNLFALDPVPGPMRHDATRARLVPENVNYSEVIQMRDDPRFLFAVQDKQHTVVQSPDTEHVYRLYPGSHSSGKYFYYGDLGQGKLQLTEDEMRNMPTPIMVGDDLARFARRTGTNLNESEFHYINHSAKSVSHAFTYEALDDKKRLELYGKMVLQKQQFQAKKVKQRDFTRYESDYFLHGVGYFNDQAHMDLFRKTYPYLFDYFFQQHREFTQYPEDWQHLNNELQSLNEASNSFTARSLCRHLKINELPTELTNNNTAGGIAIVANQYYKPGNKLRILWESVQDLTHSVICGLDKRTDKRVALALYHGAHQVLVSNQSEDGKIQAIAELIKLNCQSNSRKSGRYSYKSYSLLASCNPDHGIEKVPALPAIDTLRAYISRAGVRESQNPYVRILAATKLALEDVFHSSLEDKPTLYALILENSVNEAGKLAHHGHAPGKENYVSRLRECLLNTAVKTLPVRVSKEDKHEGEVILRAHVSQLQRIVASKITPNHLPPRQKSDNPLINNLEAMKDTLSDFDKVLDRMFGPAVQSVRNRYTSFHHDFSVDTKDSERPNARIKKLR